MLLFFVRLAELRSSENMLT